MSPKPTLLSSLFLSVLFVFAIGLVATPQPAAALDCAQCTCTSGCNTSCFLGNRIECDQDTCWEVPIYSTCGNVGYCPTGSFCGSCQALSCTTSLYGDGNNNTINGTSARECIYGYGGNDTIDGNAGDDTIYGGNGTDTLYGDSGNDCLYGEGGSDHTDGESGSSDYCEGETEVNCEL